MYPNVIGENTKTGKELNKINKIALNIAISIKGVGEGGGEERCYSSPFSDEDIIHYVM